MTATSGGLNSVTCPSCDGDPTGYEAVTGDRCHRCNRTGLVRGYWKHRWFSSDVSELDRASVEGWVVCGVTEEHVLMRRVES